MNMIFSILGGSGPHKVIPIQQGLKQSTSEPIGDTFQPHKVIPIQQGLKHVWKALVDVWGDAS